MRFFVSAILCVLIFANSATADSLLISKGTEVFTLATPGDAAELRHSQDIESQPAMYLPAGTLAIQLNNNNLRSLNPNFEILLTETGIWAFYKPDGFSFYDHNWLNATKDWAEEMAEEEYSRCPAFGPSRQIQLMFPVAETEVELYMGADTSTVEVSPGQFYYHLQDEFRGDRIVGFLPQPFENNCTEVTIPYSDVRLVTITYKGFWSTSCDMEFGNGCLYSSLNDIRRDYFLNTRILSEEERHSCATRSVVSYTEDQANELVASFATSIGANANIVDVGLESGLELTLSQRITNQERREFGPEFEVLRNFYVVADGSDVEVLEAWIKCPVRDGEIWPLTGNEQPVFLYYALESQKQSFGPEYATTIAVEEIDPTGHLIVNSPRHLKVIRDSLSTERRLEQEQIDFLMSKVFAWRN